MRNPLRKGYGKKLKERLDVLLVSKGFFQSRERAKTAIMAGDVYVNGGISDKPGTKFSEDAEITLKNDQCPYVGRGGYKLEKAIRTFSLDLSGCIAMDIGASTGGFTDCMLQNGAAKVYSVDVGYGQLDWKLRNDERVVNMEKVNVRYLDPGSIPEKMDFISIDVSFISLRLIFPVASALLGENAMLVSLIKPQFEAGREQVGRKGIVKDRAVHRQVIENVIRYALENGLSPLDLTFSPMTGAKGNIEYLLLMKKSGNDKALSDAPAGLRVAAPGTSGVSEKKIDEVISEAHATLAK